MRAQKLGKLEESANKNAEIERLCLKLAALNERIEESAVVISSTIPSEKYSCSGSPLMLSNCSTAVAVCLGVEGPHLALRSARYALPRAPRKRGPAWRCS
jgi:hypothetical protein